MSKGCSPKLKDRLEIDGSLTLSDVSISVMLEIFISAEMIAYIIVISWLLVLTMIFVLESKAALWKLMVGIKRNMIKPRISPTKHQYTYKPLQLHFKSYN